MFKKIHKFMKQNRTQNIWRTVLKDNPTTAQRRAREEGISASLLLLMGILILVFLWIVFST